MNDSPFLACRGVAPLRPRLADWMLAAFEDAAALSDLVDKHGSPLHVHQPSRMRSNIDAIKQTASERGVDMRIHFAHKANKCDHYVRESERASIGIDVASERELSAAIAADFSGDRIIVTAAALTRSLIRSAIEIGATIAVDSLDAYHEIAAVTNELEQAASVAIRLRDFEFANGRHESRFGIELSNADKLIDAGSEVRVRGLHFHLDGNSIEQRVAAIRQTVSLARSLRQRSHPIEFIDMGGGFPVQYLVTEDDWTGFHDRLDRQLAGDNVEPVVLRGNHYGRTFDGSVFRQTHRNHPTWQTLRASEWLGQILDMGGTAKSLRESDLSLQCEPGRALLDGCGITVARVLSRKPDCHGDLLIGLNMNRTNCCTTSIDFAVDPLLLTTGTGPRTPPGCGFFVGSYCAEDDWITPRRMRFDQGVAVGDLVIFPNTAGYQMHFMESAAHQAELPANVVLP